MKVYFVGAGPGDPDLITLKAKKVMERARYCIYAGSLINPEILKFFPKEAKLFDSSRMTLEEIAQVFLEARQHGEDLARIHSGDLSLYSAMQEQIAILEEMGIGYEIIPGISVFQAASALLGQELTLPGICQTVILTRMGGKTEVPEKESLKNLAQARATLCIFLSVQFLEEIVEELMDSYGPDCPVAVIYKAYWQDQRIVLSKLEKIAEDAKREGITKTALIIVGEVLAKPPGRSNLYAG